MTTSPILPRRSHVPRFGVSSLLLLAILWLTCGPASWAQTGQSAGGDPDPGDGPVHDATAVRLADDVPEGLWVELTPLAPSEASAPSGRPALLPPDATEPGLTWLPERAAGAAMLCRGVDPGLRSDPDETSDETSEGSSADRAAEPPLWATACELVALWRDDPASLLPPPDDPVLEVSAVTGPQVVGRYLLGDLPVADAVLAVVPARLDAPVRFTLPLQWTPDGPARRVVTRDDGSFRLPRLAPGDYVLEARLPGGRLHRSEPFAVPEIDALQTNSGVLDMADLVYDLGDVDVRLGVQLEVRAGLPDASPAAGVDVHLRQGRTPAELVTFRARTGEDGVARLDGLAVEAPSVLTCAAPGLATVRHAWDVLPTTLDCDMEPLAALAGEVLDADRAPIPGATVRLLPQATEGGSFERTDDRTVLRATLDDDGAFLFADVRSGRWTLEAAAPGFRVERLPVALESGERTLLDPVFLRPGREVLVRVSGPDGEPVPGAEIVALDPPGSVSATADDDGEALFAHPGPETVLEVSGLEYAAERLVVPAEEAGAARAASRGPFDVTLRPGGWIRVLVGLGSTGEAGEAGEAESAWTPCAGCEIWIDAGGGETRGARRLVTDGRGEALSPPLRPGVHRVQRTRFSQVGTTVVEEPRAEERTVRVTEGEVTTVRFTSGDETLALRFRPAPDPELGPWSLVVLTGNARRTVPPEADGSYRLDLPRGAARDLPLVLRLQRFDPETGAESWTRVAEMPWPVEQAEAGREVVVPLPGGRVQGRALRTDTAAAEAPAAGARVRLQGFHDFTDVAELRTAPDGSFEIPHLPPGVYSLQIRDIIYTYVSLRPGQTVDVGPLRLAPGMP